jgi:hypothetical protein
MMRLAVELADLLELELLGLFLEEASLRDLASIPFARELRTLGGGWHPFDLERLSLEMELAARRGERMFTEAAKRLSARSQFTVVRGSTAETIESISQTGDIVMIIEPMSEAERATQPFSWLIEAAFRSAAAVMVVPPDVVRATGPVAAIAAAPSDPSIATGAAIAAAAGEELAIVAAYDGAADELPQGALAESPGIKIHQIAAGAIARLSRAHLFRALNHLKERLVVVTRGVLDNDLALQMASARHVPVLIVEPSEATGSSAAADRQTKQ